MFKRAFKIREDNVDGFPSTEKMLLLPSSEFEDNVDTQEMPLDTVPAELMAEFEESHNAALEADQRHKDAAAIKKLVWDFQFTNSTLDLEAGAEVKEGNDDMFSRFFDK